MQNKMQDMCFFFLQGMRIVERPGDFVDNLLSAQREAAASFGVNTVLLEKYITQPRHVEVQVNTILYFYLPFYGMNVFLRLLKN
jgi:Carbamoyl-phosphate synthase L chain, ATP binding domain